jgi:hypothetical protein
VASPGHKQQRQRNAGCLRLLVGAEHGPGGPGCPVVPPQPPVVLWSQGCQGKFRARALCCCSIRPSKAWLLLGGRQPEVAQINFLL